MNMHICSSYVNMHVLALDGALACSLTCTYLRGIAVGPCRGHAHCALLPVAQVGPYLILEEAPLLTKQLPAGAAVAVHTSFKAKLTHCQCNVTWALQPKSARKGVSNNTCGGACMQVGFPAMHTAPFMGLAKYACTSAAGSASNAKKAESPADSLGRPWLHPESSSESWL